jgi:hypothetical protein
MFRICNAINPAEEEMWYDKDIQNTEHDTEIHKISNCEKCVMRHCGVMHYVTIIGRL